MPEPLAPRTHRSLVLGIVATHALAGWALLQMDAVRQAVTEAAPVMVSVVAEAAPPAPTPPAPPPPPPVKPVTPPPPVPLPVISIAPSPEPAPAITVEIAPAVAAPTPPAPAPAPTPPAPPAPPAAPVGPRMLPPSAVQYLVPPQVEYPRASRRLRETGRAIVRVFITEGGLPEQVQIEKSTGFKLLDEAALAAVRKTRFKPHTENGQPLAGWALIPLSFDLEN